jgi:hypothetical protein
MMCSRRSRLVLRVLLLYPLISVLQHCHQPAVALAHLVSRGGGCPVGCSVGTDPLDPMLPAGLEELLEADPLDRGIIVDLQPLPWDISAAHGHLVYFFCQNHGVLNLSNYRFLPMIDGLLARFCEAALWLLYLRLQLLGQLLNLLCEYRLQHQVIAA